MSHRSRTFGKLKQALTQDPATRPIPRQTWSPMPLDGDPRRPARNFTDPRQLPGMNRLTASDGLTIVMAPVRHIPGVDSAPTQQLPPVAEDLPPSARHVDPAAWHDRTHVEDNDLEPETPGRHVLAELTAGPDIATELMAVQGHIHDLFDPMRRAEVAARASDERMRAFVAQWDARQDRAEREFEKWAAWFKGKLADTRASWAETSGRTNAQRLAKAYEDGGTSAALYTTEQLAAEIARRDMAGSAVAA